MKTVEVSANITNEGISWMANAELTQQQEAQVLEYIENEAEQGTYTYVFDLEEL